MEGISSTLKASKKDEYKILLQLFFALMNFITVSFWFRQPTGYSV